MLPMSNPNINLGSVETQQMKVTAPVGVSNIRSIIGTSADMTPNVLEQCQVASTNILL
jgi:hypothetical protein